MHLYKNFFTRRYIAQTAIVKFCIGSPKTAQNEQVCAHQRSHEVNFTKSFFEQLYTGWIVVVHLYCGVSLCHQVAPQQSAKFRTAFFLVHFIPVWGRIALPIMHRFGRCFRPLLQDQMYFAMH